MPPGFEVMIGTRLPANGSKSVKHCGSGLKMMKPGILRLAPDLGAVRLDAGDTTGAVDPADAGEA
jgi:hypothetical protein